MVWHQLFLHTIKLTDQVVLGPPYQLTMFQFLKKSHYYSQKNDETKNPKENDQHNQLILFKQKNPNSYTLLQNNE